MLESVILGFLTYKDLSGYEIKKWMSDSTAHFINASFGSIYPALKRLEKKGYVTVNKMKRNNRQVNEYQLTDEGHSAFMTWLQSPVEFSQYNYEYLAKMFFYRYLTKEEICNQIEDLVRQIDEKIQSLEAIDHNEKNKDLFFEMSTLEFGKAHYLLKRQWLLDFIEKLED